MFKTPLIIPVYVKYVFVLAVLLIGIASIAFGQSQSADTANKKTTSFKDSIKDTLQKKKDSLITNIKSMPGNLKDQGISKIRSTKERTLNQLGRLKPDSSKMKSLFSGYSLKGAFATKPLIKFNGGYISYNMNYRSNIDTPFAEKNILQNSTNGNLNFAIANIPLRVNYLLRRSNSNYFRDINDIQVEFDANAYRNMLQSSLKQRLMALAPNLRDSLLELDYKIKLKDVASLHEKLTRPDQLQKLLEYKEILNLPDDVATSDSSTNITALKKEARVFISEYNKNEKQLQSLTSKKDSVEKLYHKMQDNIAKYKDFVQNKLSRAGSSKQLEQNIKDFGLNGVKIPAKYQRLMNVRKFAVGHNQLNYSELTSKNISLTGVNFEYNSWYYVAVAAGTVDYRFRDFVVNKLNKSPQYIYMARLGVGKLESNYFILTAYKGQKQLFASSLSGVGLQSINIEGFAAEGKLKLAPGTYAIGEVAESLSPDFRKTPTIKQKFDLNDRSNKAFSLKFYSYLPKTNSRIEAMYKYTGANFQSFSSFQTNSTVKAWSVKADQQFLKRKLRISASIKSNDFSNPYIIQNYKSNTVFKSIQASFRSRHFPTITVGYVPMSQLTYIDSVLVENHFQSFNAGVTHFYKIGERKATSSFVYNRFYNTSADSSFAYYNAENIFFCQRIEFLLYTMNLSISHSKSPGFELNVLDGGINVKVGKLGAVGFGVKVNDFDKIINARGAYGSFQINLKKIGVFNATYDNGYLPANNHRFLKSNQMNLNFIKQLK